MKMSEPTTMNELDLPFEPVKLVEMWQQAAQSLAEQGEATAAGAFHAASRQLSAWIRHEGQHAIMCMPTDMVRLIGVAMQFDQRDKDDWKQLAAAAVACQGAGTS
jgi:hypothetical protein